MSRLKAWKLTFTVGQIFIGDRGPTSTSGSEGSSRKRALRQTQVVLVLAAMLFASTSGQAGTAPNLLDYNGGAVLANPKIINLYMDTSWDSDNPASINQASIDGAIASLVTSSYFSSASQYGVGSASFTGSNQAGILCPTPIIAGLTDFLSISAWMQCETAPSPLPFGGTISGLPSPDSNTVYAVYVPSGTQINDGFFSSCVPPSNKGNFGAYHFFGSTLVWQLVFTPLPTPLLVPQTFAYTVVPVDCAAPTITGISSQLDGVSELVSHEITSAALSPMPNGAGWNGTPVTITFTSTDNEPGGTGVKEIHFTLSGAQNSSSVASVSKTSVTISAQGITVVTFFAIDNAGNQESPKALTVQIDLTPPSISAPPNVTVGTGPGATSCSAVVSSVILGSATATDDSGIITINVTGVPAGNVFPVGTTALVYTATDPVNLMASATQLVTVNDTTPPVLATLANITVNATSPAGAVVNYTLPAATDNCPAVSVASAPPSGNTFGIGTTTVTITATDAAHNTTSKTFTVTVVGAAGQAASLSGLVSSLGLQVGITNSLLVKLAATLAAINAGNTATACSNLTAFINEVNAQSGKKISVAEAAQLIAAAMQIQAVLGCT